MSNLIENLADLVSGSVSVVGDDDSGENVAHTTENWAPGTLMAGAAHPGCVAYADNGAEMGIRIIPKRLKRLVKKGVKTTARGIRKFGGALAKLPKGTLNTLKAGAKRIGMSPMALYMRLKSADTKRKQAAVRKGVLRLAYLKQADMKRGGQFWSSEQAVAWAKADFQRRGIPVSNKIDGHNVSGDNIGAPPAMLRWILWLNPFSWFASMIRHTINQFKPQYGLRPNEDEGTEPKGYRGPAAPPAGEGEGEYQSEEGEAPEGYEGGEGYDESSGLALMPGRQMLALRRISKMKRSPGMLKEGQKMQRLARFAALCAAGNPRACKKLARLRKRAASGNRRAANFVNAIDTVKMRGLSGVAGADIGFTPAVATLALKHGPKAARFAMKNKDKMEKATGLVNKARKGDEAAQSRIEMIRAGAKAGNPEARQAAVAVKLASEQTKPIAYDKQTLNPFTIKRD